MEQKDMFDYLIQQAPVVVVMAVVAYFGFKYFNKQITKYQKTIENKDDDIKMLNRESKEDLQKSFSVLQDVNGTLQKWIIKDESNKDLKVSINETLGKLEKTSEAILMKLDSK